MGQVVKQAVKDTLIETAVVGVAALTGVLCLVWWLRAEAPVELAERLPTREEAERSADGAAGGAPARTDIRGVFQKSDGMPSSLTGMWSRFRGESSENICRETEPLAERWPEAGPPVVWSLALGEGHAGPAVRSGRVYVLDYDEAVRADVLRCLSLDDGREIWRRWYHVRIKRNHGMSRTVPAVSDRYVVTVGPKCHALCVDAETGAFGWGIDLVADFGAKVPLWYTGQCPLIDDGIAVLAPGGTALLIGVDCQTGQVAWQTPNPRGWQMSHASVMPLTLCGRRMYVYCAIGGVIAVAADGPDRGELLWETSDWSIPVVAPSPVAVGEDHVFVTAGYGAGSMMLRVAQSGNTYTVEPVWRLSKEVFGCEQQTPIFYREHLFSVLPNDAGEHRRELVCLTPEGRVAWTSGTEVRFGLGPFLIADGKIFVLNDDGVLTLAEARVDGYHPLAQAKVLDGRDAWGPMALVNGRLLLRDWKRMLCLDVRATPDSGGAKP
ncbi:MAG: hypothetical protein A3K19_25595 [Lentisphaerae bacterium RIFOXYB12_FULL_65_16]|nr:MAG: hypothetical protein A3K18_29595 [Lentisphaerae bacterium RIFOXYA12_64_32]OGV84868.1 MAG: hypothetical protein A3K19_25595 [Lentisphaerae bacterium RIFOXYB12_FULL_65_16]